jgi:murein DD-endopeptidase MepM/ murein hydrolase activator NlpD
MSERRGGCVRRLLLAVIVVGMLVGIFVQFGDEILYWATGQDIMDDLRADLAAARPTNSPLIAALGGGGDARPQTSSDEPVSNTGGGGGLAADGFPTQPRQHVLKYVVQPGDALFTIAQKFDLHPNTIFWANTDVLQDNVHLLHVGTELYILPVNGVYYLSDGTLTFEEIAAQYGVTPGDILYSEYNELEDFSPGDIAPEGLHIVVPGGRRDFISWQAPINTGTESGRANPEGSIHPGSCRALYSGTGGSGNYMSPLGSQPYRLTQSFAAWHPGLDFAADVADTPIYAAETGVVVFAGWHRDGYGELIIIDHGDGWTTYYGHLSTRFVGCGDQVSRGQLIAEMGMTGNASGIHLHFEIRQNDIPQNPRLFLDLQSLEWHN